MIPDRYTDFGPFILRVTLGVALLAHGVYLKAFVFTLPGTAGFFASIGLPGALAYVVFATEAAAGIALVLGVGTPIAAAAITPVLLGATWAHLGAGWLFTNEGGGWEYPLFMTLAAVSLVFSGPGAFALSDSRGSAETREAVAGA